MEDIASLKAENQRLNKIIGVLLEQIDILKQINASGVSTKSNILKDTSFVSSDGGKMLNDTTSVNNDGGMIICDISPVNNDGGMMLNDTTSVNNDGGMIICDISPVNNDGGNTLKDTSADNIDGGNMLNDNAPVNINRGNIASDNASVRTVSAPIEITEANAFKMVKHIKKHLPVRVRRQSHKAIAKELMHIHNSGFASPSELRKLSGLSESGFSKHIIMLRRRGLIRKESWQKFILTDVSKQIITETFSAVPV